MVRQEQLHWVKLRYSVQRTDSGARKERCPSRGIALMFYRPHRDVPCQKAPLRHRASRPVCADATADVQHPKSGLQNTKKYGSRAVTKALGKMPAHPAEKRGLLFNFKMKEKWKVSINIKIVKSKICN